MEKEKRYWFPTRKYGWGWGLPSTWQGWLVLAVYAVSLGVLILRIPPGSDPARYALYFTGLTLALLAVCWLKGEPPRWRWGGK